jgi:Glycosyltransferase
LPLKIVGKGPELNKLKKIAKSNIEFYHQPPNQVVEDLMSQCRGFVYAGIEDFGIAPIEAMASGSPVIALSKGGITDSVSCITENTEKKFPTGLLFKNQTSEDLIEAIKWFEEKKAWKNFDPENLNNFAQKFNHKNFNQKFNDFVNIKRGKV